MVLRKWEEKVYLVGGVAGQATKSALHGAGGLVNIALEGRGLVLVVGVGGHGCGS